MSACQMTDSMPLVAATSGAAALGVSLVGMVGGLTFLALAVINA